MTKDQLTKARSYAIDKMRYNEVHSIYNELETTVELVLNSFPVIATLLHGFRVCCCSVLYRGCGKYRVASWRNTITTIPKSYSRLSSFSL